MKITNNNQLKSAYQALLIMTDGNIKRKVSHHAGLETLKREIRRYNRQSTFICDNYYVIDRMHKPQGIFKLWEHRYFGEYMACTVTLNGQKVGETLDDLQTWYEDEYMF